MVRNVNVGERISDEDSQVKTAIVMDSEDAEILQKLILEKEMEQLQENLHYLRF